MTHSILWSQLPPIPDGEGFVGGFSGVSAGALVVAGGANVVGDRWAEPLQKKWYDSVFVLVDPIGPWLSGLKPPRPVGYGVSITTEDGLVCTGGRDGSRHFAEVFRLQWRDAQMDYTELPSLPRTSANACGALIGQTIYVAGGLETPAATNTIRNFWALDLSAAAPSLRELQPWPGPARMLSVAGARERSFYLFSGSNVSEGPDGAIVRDFCRDAYGFTLGQGWRRLADLPRVAVAAPTPVPAVREAELLVLGGDDGSLMAFSPIEKHLGFQMDILAYDVSADHWRNDGFLPFSRATTPAVSWNHRTVIPSGEVKPRVRTPEVWMIEEKGK